ncbi:hypothetical protein J0S82_001594 [Galemys pyrenaicus]|uniref:Uncharacterized protein n=1 Tax=Galemys pyrenaicus TaxID=202257 RepID=A0A8J5ZWP7_GALPY|nr:hypothetical protein J0S82_001594 [Galemys pyrenaicus]
MVLLAQMSKSLALVQSRGRAGKTWKFSSCVMTLAFSSQTFFMGLSGPVSCVSIFSSSTELSPFFRLEGFLEKRMSSKGYSFSRYLSAWRNSVDLLCLPGFTEIQMARETLWMPVTRNSCSLKLLLTCTLVLYLTLGYRTMGEWGLTQRGVGLQAARPVIARGTLRLLTFCAG